MILSFVAQVLTLLLDLFTARRHPDRAKDPEIALLLAATAPPAAPAGPTAAPATQW